MRKDMKRVLITRPRLGSRHGHNTDIRALRSHRVDVDGNSEPKRRSIKPKRDKWYHKTLNEYLNPLKRYLRSQVGRRWDDVYSEINESSPVDSVIGAHIYQHLFQFICVRPEVIDGIFYRRDHVGRLLVIRSGDLYVDRHGLIRNQINEKHQDQHRYTKAERRARRKRNKHKKSYQRVQAPSCIALGPHEELVGGVDEVAEVISGGQRARGLRKALHHRQLTARPPR